jgi:ATP-dependent DNA helicase RecQ
MEALFSGWSARTSCGCDAQPAPALSVSDFDYDYDFDSLPTTRPAGSVANEAVRVAADPARRRGANGQDLHAILQEVFGYGAFRGEQQDIIQTVTAGDDAMVLMPTGGGKSLCYQVPAIARHRAGLGVTLVISPLIALMHDQVGALEELGVHAAFLNSSLSGDQAQHVEREMMSGRLVMLYAAPERVTNPRFMAMLTALDERGLLSLVAIDEAHCVSQWGHDFREDYLQLAQLHERFPDVPRVALTATADDHTRADMRERLALAGARQFISSFDRPNIRYTIVEKDEAKKQLLRFLRDEHEGNAGIVYCQSRKKVEESASWLTAEGIPALAYHAGLDADVRRRHQDRFLREDGLVMCATIAFGMGIDKPDVRFVAHLDLPKNIEGYYQETGRAGRDGEAADAWMAYGLADVVNQRRMIDESPAGDEFKKMQRGKLDALLTLAEAHDCRRMRLLAYFGEQSTPCGNCDNCISAPATWDATEAARMALSTVYRFRQHSGLSFGAGHLIDVLRGKVTDKTTQHGHGSLSTFGIGAKWSEQQWRGVIRQLLSLGHLQSEGEYTTLVLTDSARAVLKGEITITLREARELPRSAGRTKRVRTEGGRSSSPAAAALQANMDGDAKARLAALKAWRSEVAREHNLPAYIVFNDATLSQMALTSPSTLDELSGISGVGAKKLEAYGREILRVLESAAG